MLKIQINDKRGFIEAKDAQGLGVIIDTLSGRKSWKDEGIFFEPNPANLDLLKSFRTDIEFVGDSGILAKIDELEGLPDQYADLPDLCVDYEPNRGYLPIQGQTLRQSHNRKVFAHLHPPDKGKTGIQIHEAGILFRQGLITGCFIIAPNTVDQQWMGEIPKDLDPRISWHGNCWDKKIKEQEDFNKYDDHLEFFSLNIDSYSRGTKGSDTTVNFIKAHQGRILMILDESHDIRNTSKRTNRLIKIATNEKGCSGFVPSHKRIATGTLIGKSLMDAFTQFLFLDQRILKHKYKLSYQSEYCVMGGFEGREIIGSRNNEKFWKRIAPHSFRIGEAEERKAEEEEAKKNKTKKKEPAKFIKHEYKLDKKLSKVYKDMKETFLVQIETGEISTVKVALTAQMRLQQINSGYLTIDQEKIPGMKRAPKPIIRHISDQRQNFCLDIVKKIDGPVIIWVRFVPDMELLTELMEKNGYSVGVYRGNKNHKLGVKERFLGGKLDIMIANPASGGVGLNLQGICTDDIYYSMSHNSIHYWQSLKRIDRRGSSGGITHHIIVCKGTVDVGILGNLDRKERTKRLSLDDIRITLGGESFEVVQPRIEKPNKVVDICDEDFEELLG